MDAEQVRKDTTSAYSALPLHATTQRKDTMNTLILIGLLTFSAPCELAASANYTDSGVGCVDDCLEPVIQTDCLNDCPESLYENRPSEVDEIELCITETVA